MKMRDSYYFLIIGKIGKIRRRGWFRRKKNELGFFKILKIVNKGNYSMFGLSNFYKYGYRRKESKGGWGKLR